MIDSLITREIRLAHYGLKEIKIPDFDGSVIIDGNRKPLFGLRFDKHGVVVKVEELASPEELKRYEDLGDQLSEVDYL